MMKAYTREIDPALAAFWRAHAAPGRIGLIHIDMALAKLINWAEGLVTPNGEPSLWTHCFLFIESREGEPWIAESDAHVPLPGFRPKLDGPQENSIDKWAISVIDRALVVDAGLSIEQIRRTEATAKALIEAGYTYRYSELADAWIALLKKDLKYTGPLYSPDSMHCAHFLRECLKAAGCDPFGDNILPKNTVPEFFAQKFPPLAEWKKTPHN
jgi:hypothetical protein